MAADEPAFPRDHRFQGHNGMTLRDWFAGQALAGYLSDPNVGGDPKETALRMYVFADAMLKAREQSE